MSFKSLPHQHLSMYDKDEHSTGVHFSVLHVVPSVVMLLVE
jgi:hypothetical protein